MTFIWQNVNVFESTETGSPQLLVTGDNNSVVSCDDISIDQFFFVHSARDYSYLIKSTIVLYDDWSDKLPEDGPKSLLHTSRYIVNTWISWKN